MKPQLVPQNPEPPDMTALLEALQQHLAPAEGDPGWTSAELAEQLRVSPSWVRSLLNRLKRDGRLLIGKQWRESLNGRIMRHTVYRLRHSKGE